MLACLCTRLLARQEAVSRSSYCPEVPHIKFTPSNFLSSPKRIDTLDGEQPLTTFFACFSSLFYFRISKSYVTLSLALVHHIVSSINNGKHPATSKLTTSHPITDHRTTLRPQPHLMDTTAHTYTWTISIMHLSPTTPTASSSRGARGGKPAGRGGRGRGGRGGRRQDDRPKPTEADLDAEMEDYQKTLAA